MDNFIFTESARPPNHQRQAHASFLSSSAHITAVRDQLEAWLRHQSLGLDEMRIYDIVLAANELMVNAFEHGDPTPSDPTPSDPTPSDPPGCLFDIRRIGHCLTITVTNAVSNATILPASQWAMPQALQPNGRGLAIVNKLADDVVLTDTESSVTIAAMFDLSPPNPREQARPAAVAV